MPEPLVIQCAITGSVDPDPERRPNLPTTPEAIVAEALAAWRAGATVLHLHAREPDGTPTQDREAYRGLVDALRDAGCAAIVNVSCGTAGGRAVRDERLGPLELAPEMASFDCGSINFREQLFEGDLPFLRRMAETFRGHVRTGLEDNLWYRRGRRATNAMLVERIVRIATELDRPLATPDEARTILGLEPR
ncbi:MAG: 3-keto-5-aminohexanoate cleavage protein [Solirubrobacteraceae bacterium]|nr:3-keto-5-aminohexanoate cleavage protein [Solirubrobacteraceae bacterium]